MATHFQGRFEVEFKYRLTDSAAFVHTLTALSPEVMVADNHEQDCYFDTADGALAREEKSLIIRTMAPSGIRLWIVKGPGPDRCGRSTSPMRTRRPAWCAPWATSRC